MTWHDGRLVEARLKALGTHRHRLRVAIPDQRLVVHRDGDVISCPVDELGDVVLDVESGAVYAVTVDDVTTA